MNHPARLSNRNRVADSTQISLGMLAWLSSNQGVDSKTDAAYCQVERCLQTHYPNADSVTPVSGSTRRYRPIYLSASMEPESDSFQFMTGKPEKTLKIG
jgi:hypothetical protein